MKALTQKSIFALTVFSAISLSACNIQDQVDEEKKQEIKKSITGVITSLDQQLTVNSVQYDPTNAKIYINGKEVAYTELKNGMVVTVSGTQASDGSGTALTITADTSVDGVVSSNNVMSDGSGGSLDVLGQNVRVDDKTVFESRDQTIKSLADIQPSSVVEVSGYTDGDGTVWATRVEVKSSEYSEGTEMELEGVITNLTDTSFDIGGVTVEYTDASFDDRFNGQLSEGQYVEVKSYTSLDINGVLSASKIELESNSGSPEIRHNDDDQEVDVEGVVTAVISDSEIEVNGVKVYLNNLNNLDSQLLSQLTQGVFVEVEGYIDADGNFMVTKLELEKDDDSGKSSGSSADDLDDSHENELQQESNEIENEGNDD